MTLVELLVAMAIGLGITLAVTSMLITGENHKRTTTSTNDAEQNGAYAFYALDRVLKGAGSGFAEAAYPVDRGVLGCKLNVGTFLPRSGAFPPPFDASFLGGAPSNLRVAPLLIAAGQSSSGSDVLVVMSGSGSAGAVPRQVTGAGGSTSLILDSTVAFSTNDLALVSQSGVTDCLVEQVTSISSPTLNLGGTYYTVGSTTTLATLSGSTSTYVTALGNAQANNLQFLLYGVGANRTLYSYDLLQNLYQTGAVTADAAQPIADGVDKLYAIYGIDLNGDGILDTWASPAESGYDINTVMVTPATMRKIIAVRVALVVRGEYGEKATNLPVSPPTLKLFAGYTNAAAAPLEKDVSLSADDQLYRYRVFEFTVPLRNMLLLAGASAP